MTLDVNMLNDSCNLEAGRKANNSRQKTTARYKMSHKLGSGHIPWNDLDQRFSTFLSWTKPYNNFSYPKKPRLWKRIQVRR